MPKKDRILENARVLAAVPNATFWVELANGHKVLAHTSGKMRLNHINVMIGDEVIVDLCIYDLTRGCIIYRKKI